MNTTLASERSLDRNDRHVRTDAWSARISPVDRLSLRLGLWLLLRSTRRLRPAALAHRAHEAARVSQRARTARDAASLAHLRAHHRA